jgi:hypothetical protein
LEVTDATRGDPVHPGHARPASRDQNVRYYENIERGRRRRQQHLFSLSKRSERATPQIGGDRLRRASDRGGMEWKLEAGLGQAAYMQSLGLTNTSTVKSRTLLKKKPCGEFFRTAGTD